jgi:hypothetical protein
MKWIGASLLLVVMGCSPGPTGSMDSGTMMGTDAMQSGETGTGAGLTGTWAGTSGDRGMITSTFGGASADAVSTVGVLPNASLGQGCQTRIETRGTFTFVNNYLMLTYATGTRATTGCMDASLNVAAAPGAASDFGLVDYSSTLMISNNMFTAMIGSTTFTFTRQM